MNIAALQFAGITPPDTGLRCPCPHCSPYRSKPNKKCLRLYPDGMSISWLCWHCGWEGVAE